MAEISDEDMRQGLAQTRAYSVVLLRASEQYGREGSDEIIWEHGRNFSLRADGLLSIVGPVTDDTDLCGVGILCRDRLLAQTRVVSLTPQQVRQAFARWERAGKTVSVIAGRFRVLRAAIGWAYDERIIYYHPIRTMRGPARPEPRRPIRPRRGRCGGP